MAAGREKVLARKKLLARKQKEQLRLLKRRAMTRKPKSSGEFSAFFRVNKKLSGALSRKQIAKIKSSGQLSRKQIAKTKLSGKLSRKQIAKINRPENFHVSGGLEIQKTQWLCTILKIVRKTFA